MDLLIIIAISIIVMPLVALTSGTIRAILGVIFVLFIPGYTLISALFPRRDSLNNMERLVLSIGASMAIVTGTGIILNFTPLGIRLWPVIITLFLFIIVTSGIAWLRRRLLPVDQRFILAFAMDSAKSVAVSQNKNSKFKNIIYAVLIVVVLGSLVTVYALSSLSARPNYTEFYLLSAQGTTTNYPRTLHLGESVTIDAVLVNHQPTTLDYNINITINGQEVAIYKEIHLMSNDKWQKELSFIPQSIGDNQKVEFTLFKSENTTPEDNLYIWIDVVK
jgi:uncharacterized membrane protein